MTQLKCLEDIEYLDIKSIQEVANESSKTVVYGRWFDIERRLIKEGKAPSLSAYLLYEYQFNRKSTTDLGKEFGFAAPTMKFLLRRIGIPIRDISESTTGIKRTQEWRDKIAETRRKRRDKYNYAISQEQREKISQANKGKVRSPEMRKRASEYWTGKGVGENNPNYGNHLSEDAKRRIGEPKRGKPLSDEHRNAISEGLRNLPKEVLSRGGSRLAHEFALRAYHVQGRFHTASQQEGAVALLLEKYILNYKIEDKENYQVRGNGIYNGGIDFLVENEFLEWHPIVFMARVRKIKGRGDIPTNEEFESYKRILATLETDERTEFQEEYKKVIGRNYINVRQQAVDNSDYRGMNVALATTPNELYDFISKHNQRNKEIPSRQDFKREFNQLIGYVKGFKVNKEKSEEAVA